MATRRRRGRDWVARTTAKPEERAQFENILGSNIFNVLVGLFAVYLGLLLQG